MIFFFSLALALSIFWQVDRNAKNFPEVKISMRMEKRRLPLLLNFVGLYFGIKQKKYFQTFFNLRRG